MAKNTTRSKSGTCVCDWKECSDWTEVFKQSSKYEKLGHLVCVKLGNQNKSNESKYNEKKLMFENYMKVLCAHLKIDYKCVSDRTQVWVAKHHFPWTPILKDEIRYFSTPISLEKARNYGIGVVPDRRNIAIESKKGNKYFFVPNVARNAVKKLADELAEGHINYRAARVQSRSTPAKSTIADNDQNMVSPQPDVMKVSKIRDYIASVSTLTQMLEFIVDSHLSDISADNPYDSDKFNSSLHANLHYRNISKLLKDFYRCKGSVFVKKESKMAVYYCKGIGDESKCMKTVFYKKLIKGNVPLCSECRREKYNDNKRSTRKRKAGDTWTEHDSKVNITVLSPGSRAKRLRQNRYIKHNLQYKLKAALSNQPHIELDGENSKDEQIMKLMEGASRVSSDDYTKFRAMMIESLSSNIAIKQKKGNSRDDTDPSIANFVDDILNKIRNFRLVREGKKKSVRYTAREIRLALSLYNMNPAGSLTLTGLEFSVYVACIFNERFMNKGQSITRENIDELEVEMKSNLEYFKDWILSAYNQKGTEMYRDKKDKWTECCIDKKTYNNLRIQICGFFYFARNLLQHDERVKYIPFLFSNTSSLESFFSQIRARNADTPQKYCAAVSALESKKTMDTLRHQRNGMYDGTVDENEVQVVTFGFNESVESTYESRSAIVDSWLSKSSNVRKTISPLLKKQQGVGAAMSWEDIEKRILDSMLKTRLLPHIVLF